MEGEGMNGGAGEAGAMLCHNSGRSWGSGRWEGMWWAREPRENMKPGGNTASLSIHCGARVIAQTQVSSLSTTSCKEELVHQAPSPSTVILNQGAVVPWDAVWSFERCSKM